MRLEFLSSRWGLRKSGFRWMLSCRMPDFVHAHEAKAVFAVAINVQKLAVQAADILHEVGFAVHHDFFDFAVQDHPADALEGVFEDPFVVFERQQVVVQRFLIHFGHWWPPV